MPDGKFWIAGRKEIPTFKSDPWEFYEHFLPDGPYPYLVLCNDGTEIRTMKIFDFPPDVEGDILLQGVQHPNLVDICEAFLFRIKLSVILEYRGFSVEDLLQHSLLPTEREIAHIISQVCCTYPWVNFIHIDFTGLGWYAIHPVKGTFGSPNINR